MWGDGGKFYWGRREYRKAEGVVVLFAWMSSQERHLRNYVDLYASLGWNSLVCHSEFLNLFSPDRATTLAVGVVNELIKELKTRPSPVVFAAFSGGPKSCMYIVLQIINGTCEVHLNLDECHLVRDCISGQVYDSSPVDFTSDLGTRFILHPTVLQISRPPRFVSWVANKIASGLDAMFLNKFESQRAEYWQTLYASAKLGGPYLIFYSENDDLAPYQTICNFAQRLRELGGDVKVVKWNNSSHVGHYRHYPTDYKAAVTELLGKATSVYTRKIEKLKENGEGSSYKTEEISESICNLRKATMTSNQSLLKVAVEPSDHFFLPGLNESGEDREVGSTAEERREGLIHMQNPPAINAHGIIGQILFDVCVPKNIEGWDIKASSSLSGQSRKHLPFNPIKCIRRSRL